MNSLTGQIFSNELTMIFYMAHFGVYRKVVLTADFLVYYWHQIAIFKAQQELTVFLCFFGRGCQIFQCHLRLLHKFKHPTDQLKPF
jgi:hypothetical protein